ncbi:MAG TPA: cyclic nucleotide-binding domain-containing protein [Acidimicrobiales bacterium]|nr:cyclic nucleotide-binding domain-containing protein [Acidimicrobiales bacterium]
MFRRSDHIPESLASSPLASMVPLRELRALDRRGTSVRVATGHTVMQEAGIGRECMVVIDGSFLVHRGDQVIAELASGDFIGEGSLLTDRPRSATVTASQDSTVHAFNPREFRSLLSECPTIAAHVRAVADERSLVA